MRFTWNELLERCPEIAELRDNAKSIAEHAEGQWYERWLPTSAILRDAVNRAAWQLRANYEDVRQVVLPKLLKTYRDAKRRLQPAAPSYGRF